MACKAAGNVGEAVARASVGEVAAFQALKTPRPLPNLAFLSPDGKPMTLADMKGRTVLLNLWATWCAPCRKEMPALDELQGVFGGKDFEVAAINIDTRNLDNPAPGWPSTASRGSPTTSPTGGEDLPGAEARRAGGRHADDAADRRQRLPARRAARPGRMGERRREEAGRRRARALSGRALTGRRGVLQSAHAPARPTPMPAPLTSTPLIALDAVALDTETTGLDVRKARLIEIAIVPVGGGDALVDSLVACGEPVPAASTAVHGIRSEDLAGVPSFASLHAGVAAALAGRVVVDTPSASTWRCCARSAPAPDAPFEASGAAALDVRILAQIAAPQLSSYSLEGLPRGSESRSAGGTGRAATRRRRGASSRR